MKILWLINIVLPQVAWKHNEKVNSTGGWMISLSCEIPKNNQLTVCYPYNKDCNDRIDGVSYYGFQGKDNKKTLESMVARFKEILIQEKPDVIHIWGTEHLQSYAMTVAATQLNLEKKIIVSIQGMVWYYAMHFMANLPIKVQLMPTVRDVIRNDSLLHQKANMIWRGDYEKKTIESINHVIGRTTWDRICVETINPAVKYHLNNEILRDSFYVKKWNIDGCDKYSIFVSQAQTPIKGFHFVLEAAVILKKKYPQLQIYVAGSLSPFNNGVNSTAYSKYLYMYAKKNDLLKSVTYIGSLNEKQMCDRFLRSHVFVSASSIENSPNSVGEAMLLGVPIVASNVGGTSDMLRDRIDGFLYQYDASYMLAGYVDRIFSNESLAKQFSKSAREHAMLTHNRERNYQDLIHIYEEISKNAESYVAIDGQQRLDL